MNYGRFQQSELKFAKGWVHMHNLSSKKQTRKSQTDKIHQPQLPVVHHAPHHPRPAKPPRDDTPRCRLVGWCRSGRRREVSPPGGALPSRFCLCACYAGTSARCTACPGSCPPYSAIGRPIWTVRWQTSCRRLCYNDSSSLLSTTHVYQHGKTRVPKLNQILHFYY